MTATIQAGALTKALSSVVRVLDKTNIPVLSHVRLAWRGGTGTVIGTNMEIAITTTFPMDGEAGECVVPGVGLLEAVKRLPAAAVVSLTVGTDALAISCGKFRANLKTWAVADFPQMTGGEFSCQFGIAAPALLTLLDRTWFAASTNETRTNMCGVYLHAAGGKLRAAATDGGMFALDETEAETNGLPGTLIPTRAVVEIRRMLDGGSDVAAVSVSFSRLRIVYGDTEIVTKLVDATFIDYDRYIPHDHGNIITARRSDIVAAVDAVAAFGDAGKGQNGSSAVVRIDMSADAVAVSAASSTTGDARDEIAGATYRSEPLVVGMLARNLIAVCGGLVGEVRMAFGSADDPVMLTQADAPGLLYLVMPYRI